MSYITISDVSLDTDNNSIKISAIITAEGSGNYLEGLAIDTHNSFVCASEPSSLATNIAFTIDSDDHSDSTIRYEATEAGYVPVELTDYVISLDGVTSGVLSTADINKDLFFVFVKAKVINEDSESIETYACGVTFNQNDLYQTVFNSIHTSIIKNGCCTRPEAGANMVMLFEAFQLSWSTADPRKYIYYWNLIHNNNLSSNSNCLCNG